MRSKTILSSFIYLTAALSAGISLNNSPINNVGSSSSYSSFHSGTPIFIPRKHTVESYRSQQRKAKKRKYKK